MKKKRFRKVVEWEEEPDIEKGVIGLLIFITGILNICYMVFSVPYSILSAVVLILTAFMTIVGFFYFIKSFGAKKEVYYVEVKE